MKSNVAFHSSHNIVYIKRMDTLEHAYKLLTKIGTRHLPVVDEKNEVIGMLSDRDVIRAMKKPVNSGWSALPPNPEFDPDDSVQEFMSWPIGTIDESASVVQAAELMLERKISALLVTRNSMAVGIVTTEDLLTALVKDQKTSLSDIKNHVFGAIYRSPVGNIIQSLANVGI